ncbi:hypothetical protein [Parasitella parasitica]|uniref:Uncharacterized protein n=1 Tax=Parasitella parasitica TaxID=35722 RepID=A0A0B7NEI4_9FUNG|nr:hypothetical protein [Parasitella parasitica]
MAFRAATQHALNMRLIMNTTRQPIAITAVRPRSTLSTGEVVHEEDEIMGVWAPDLHNYSPYKAAGQFALCTALFTGFAAIVYKFYPDKVAVPRTYPYNGLTEEFGAREGDIRPRGARVGQDDE